MGFCENSPWFYCRPLLALKLIKCTRIYGPCWKMKRINGELKIDGHRKVMTPEIMCVRADV